MPIEELIERLQRLAHDHPGLPVMIDEGPVGLSPLQALGYVRMPFEGETDYIGLSSEKRYEE